MNINQLECFISLAETLSFTKSARQMYITQPSFSRHISSLEEELEVTLFFRNKRAVMLTDSGKVFLEEAKKIIYHYNNGILRVRQVENGKEGSIKIGFLGPAARPFLPKLIKKIRNKYPSISLKFSEYSHSSITEAIRNNEIDIAFTVLVALQSIEDLVWKYIYNDCLCVVLHKEHYLANKDTIDLKELANEPFVSMDRKDWRQGYNRVEKICLEHGFSPVIVAEERYLSSLLTLVECEVGYGIVPRCFQKVASKDLSFINIEKFNEPDEVVVAWKKSNNNMFIPMFIEEVEKFIPYINEILL